MELDGDVGLDELERQFQGKIERKPERIEISDFGSVPTHTQVWVLIVFGLAFAVGASWFYSEFFIPVMTIIINAPVVGVIDIIGGAMYTLVLLFLSLFSIFLVSRGVYNGLGSEEIIVIKKESIANGRKLRGISLRGRSVTYQKMRDLRVGRKGGSKGNRLVVDLKTVEIISDDRIITIGNLDSGEMADSVRLLIISLFRTVQR